MQQVIFMVKTAADIAHWIVKKLSLADSFSDKVRLHKLLFFTWLIYYAKHKESLFEEDFLAFKKGPVVDTISYKVDLDLSEIREMANMNYLIRKMTLFV
jgi:uncharacterized phage-associated protein